MMLYSYRIAYKEFAEFEMKVCMWQKEILQLQLSVPWSKILF